MLILSFIFACVGVAFEVLLTAISDYPKKRNIRLTGHSYVWMFPIYALIPVFLDTLYPRLRGAMLLGRLAVYVVLLLSVEYISGWILRKTIGTCPWEDGYLKARWGIHGLTRLDYAPIWAVVCFVFERVYLALIPLRGLIDI